MLTHFIEFVYVYECTNKLDFYEEIVDPTKENIWT
jgi:hypothetical protein